MAHKKRIERVKIVDLPGDEKVTEEEIARVRGGSTSIAPPTGMTFLAPSKAGSVGYVGVGVRGCYSYSDGSDNFD